MVNNTLNNPPSYKELLILVAGATPQIITETIYALSQKHPPVYPDNVYIITTTTGRKRIEDTLIKQGILKKLIREYNIPPFEFGGDSFIVVKDSAGIELDDIRDEPHNEIMGNLITSIIQEKSADNAVRLHCSIAGGRKTMSFYMGAAMQLFGRPWDKLYHILVTPEFETNPDFFYKPKKNRMIEGRLPDGTVKRINTKDAEIFLAELPFIRLRDKLTIPLQGKGFKELVTEGQKDLDIATIQPELMIDLSSRLLIIGGVQIKMTPVHLITYTAFARQKTDHCQQPERPYCLQCTDCFKGIVGFKRGFSEDMIKDYSILYPLRTSGEWLNKWSREAILSDTIRQNISKINSSIKTHLNNDLLQSYYKISSLGNYGDTKYGIRVEKGKIRIV